MCFDDQQGYDEDDEDNGWNGYYKLFVQDFFCNYSDKWGYDGCYYGSEGVSIDYFDVFDIVSKIGQYIVSM